jgi:MFS family permease
MSQIQTGWGALLSGRNGIRALALAGGVALHAINVYLATTILPSVIADIGGLDYYAWNTMLFVVASIIGSATSATLLSVSGARMAYVLAAIIFGFGTLFCAMATSMPMMLVGRFIQGLGGGLLFALSYTMIRFVFAEPLWPRAMALVSGMWGVATLIGPAIGGMFAELGEWRVAFWSMLPLIALFALMAFSVLPNKSSSMQESSSLPIIQLVLLSLIVVAISAGSLKTTVIWNLGGIFAALLLLVILVMVERVAKQRLLPTGAFSLKTRLGLIFLTMSLLAVSVTASEIFVPLFLQVLHGQQPLIAGYMAAAMAAGWTLGSISSSGAQGNHIKRAICLSPFASLFGMAALAALVPIPGDGAWQTLLPICIALLLVGTGVGIGWPHLLTRVLQVAPKDEEGLASAAITTVQLFATALGAALAGMVTNMAGLLNPGGIEGTASAAVWLFAVFAIAPFIALFSSARLFNKPQ